MPPSSVVNWQHLYQAIPNQDRVWKIDRLPSNQLTEILMYIGGGLIGTILLVALIVWVVRRA